MTDIKRGAHGGQAYTHRAVAQIAQAAAVQNTWYTVLDTTENVRIIAATMSMSVAIETLEMQITIDGQVIAGAQAAAAIGTTYKAGLITTVTTQELGFVFAADMTFMTIRSFMLEGTSVRVQVRKTTAVGAGTLSSSVIYASRS